MKLKTKILGAVAAPIAGLALLAMTADPGSAAAAGTHAQTQGGGQGMMGGGMMGRGQGKMGGGMMGGGQGMAGRGMMGGMMKMMHGMMGRQGMMGQGMMGGAMGQGMRVVPSVNVTIKDVRLFMEKRLERLGNKRLKVGPIKKVGERKITADIVTVDNSLVRRFEIDPTTGLVKKTQ